MNETHFPKGKTIIEPRSNFGVRKFTSVESMYIHVFDHVILRDNDEKWDELNIIDRDMYHRLVNDPRIQELIQDFVSEKVPKTSQKDKKKNKTTKYNKCSKGHNKRHSYKYDDEDYEYDWEDETDSELESQKNAEEKKFEIDRDDGKLFKRLKEIPEFNELVKAYRKKLSMLLNQTDELHNPHYHILKSSELEPENSFVQVIKLLDVRSGIMIIANHKYYTVDNCTENFQKMKQEEEYVVTSGYRFHNQLSEADRMLIFQDLEQELTINESQHDADYPVFIDSQSHNVRSLF